MARGAGSIGRAGKPGTRLGWWIAFGALWAIGVVGVAQAAPLPFTGSLAIQISTYGAGVPGSGIADVDAYGHLGAFGLPASAFRADGLVVTITDPAAAPAAGFQITARNAAGSFTRPGGGSMPLLGSAKVCLFGACSAATVNLEVPLSVIGSPGKTTTVDGPIALTVSGAPWTTGTVSVGTATAMGFARGPGSQTSSTARASGEIQLVTPILISTNLGNDLAQVPAFGVLTLHFVPEPTTLALVGAGLVVTGWIGRRRVR